jgi:hypothetical protein
MKTINTKDIFDLYASHTIYAYENATTNEGELYVANGNEIIASFERVDDDTYKPMKLWHNKLQKVLEYESDDDIVFTLVHIGERHDVIYLVTLDQIRSWYSRYDIYTYGDEGDIMIFDDNGICIARFAATDEGDYEPTSRRYDSCEYDIGESFEHMQNECEPWGDLYRI